MVANVLVQQFLVNRESVQLGRFVVSVEELEEEYHDPPCDPPAECTVTTQTKYKVSQQTDADSDFTAALTRLVSASRSKRSKTSTQVTSDKVTTYKLNQLGTWFQRSIKLEATRKWMEQVIDQGDDIYLVTGFHTLHDARIVEDVAIGGHIGGHAQIPLSAALVASGVLVPFGDTIDPSVSVKQTHDQGTRRTYTAPGEKICAIQYRRVRYRWFSSRELDKSYLDKRNVWKAYTTLRGKGVDDVLEVELQEERDPDEVELGPGYEKDTLGAEGEFYS